MAEQMDHARCSELLAPFARGELSADQAAEVEAHLAICPECSQESAGLGALFEGETPQLSELERARLRRVVLSEAVPLPESGPVPAEVASSRGARLYRLVGAAALLLAIGGFAYLGLGQQGGSDESGGELSTTSGGADSGQSESLERATTEDAETFDGQGGSAASGATADSLRSKAAVAPSPSFDENLGKVDERRLNKLGKEGLPLVVFSRAYSTADVAEHQAAYIEQVASQAPTARGEDIRDCAGPVTRQFPNSLLAYGAMAEFEDRGDILILAWAWTDEDEGPLEQSMVWAWSIGDCDGIPVHYSKNVIRPRADR